MHAMKLPPIPTNEKLLKQAEIDVDLWRAVEPEMKKRGLNFRKLVEWGLKAFLLIVNPKAAAKIGIFTERLD